ncbi:MAG: deoxyribodipyrimidine photo-lyase, partial [Armatimonadetes bacterium]|nr:deoxyribodipyrimidine photo-lyase [Armatimonadota bacterium]
MQQSQRADCNHALEYTVQQANRRGLPVVVAFGLMDDYPEATLRHYRFMLEGLQETAAALRERGIAFVLRLGRPEQVALELSARAALTVCDCGYTRHQRRWRELLAGQALCPVEQVEADLVVPVRTASVKAEYAARTLRPRIGRCLPEVLEPLKPTPVRHDAGRLRLPGISLDDLESVLGRLHLDRTV